MLKIDVDSPEPTDPTESTINRYYDSNFRLIIPNYYSRHRTGSANTLNNGMLYYAAQYIHVVCIVRQVISRTSQYGTIV